MFSRCVIGLSVLFFSCASLAQTQLAPIHGQANKAKHARPAKDKHASKAKRVSKGTHVSKARQAAPGKTRYRSSSKRAKKARQASRVTPLSPPIHASPAQLVDRYSSQIFKRIRPVGMTLIVVDGNNSYQRLLGETRYRSGIPPQPDSLIRLASVSKLMTSEVLVALSQEGRLRLTDPLQRYAPAGVKVPAGPHDEPITLLNLATHTSGLPREIPLEKPANTPVFTFPTQPQRWQWLAQTRMGVRPGQKAWYSNLAYDMLADALARAAGKPYNALLQEKVIGPLGMHNTTFTPTAQQCARLMQGIDASPCTPTLAADGSGGVYSTPHDIQLWLHSLLHPKSPQAAAMVQGTQAAYFKRNDLRSLVGMDHAGQADALGLGWVYMEPGQGLPAIYQKTGGGGGFLTYVALNPQRKVGVFVAITRGTHISPRVMINSANKLLAALVANS